VLTRLGIRPHRPLDQDLTRTETATSYAGAGSSVSVPKRTGFVESPTTSPPAMTAACACSKSVPETVKTGSGTQCGCHSKADVPRLEPAEEIERNGRSIAHAVPIQADGRPDFARMDVTQRLSYHRKRLGLGT
jgi:hypothetical protein